MKRAVNILGVLFFCLMLVGLFMQSDTGITVAGIGVLCGLICFVLGRYERIRRLFDNND